MLCGKATLPLWNEPKHNYVGPAVTEIINGPVGQRRAWFSGRRPISRPKKSKIFHEKNVKEFQFYIRMPKFSFLGSIIKKTVLRCSKSPLNRAEHAVSYLIQSVCNQISNYEHVVIFRCDLRLWFTVNSCSLSQFFRYAPFWSYFYYFSVNFKASIFFNFNLIFF